MSDARRILFEKTEIETETQHDEAKELSKKQLLSEIKRFSSETVENSAVETQPTQNNEPQFVVSKNYEIKKSELISEEMFSTIPELEHEEIETVVDVNKAFQKDLASVSNVLPETQTQKKKSMLFRVKIVTVAFIMSASLLGGVSIHNALQYNSLSQAVQVAKETDFQVKLEKLILKIIGADGSQEKVESIVTAQPDALQDISELSAPTNWWNKICSAISNFFGGGIG